MTRKRRNRGKREVRILTLRARVNRVGKNRSMACFRCGKDVEVGERYIPRLGGKIYHGKCWEEMFI